MKKIKRPKITNSIHIYKYPSILPFLASPILLLQGPSTLIQSNVLLEPRANSSREPIFPTIFLPTQMYPHTRFRLVSIFEQSENIDVIENIVNKRNTLYVSVMDDFSKTFTIKPTRDLVPNESISNNIVFSNKLQLTLDNSKFVVNIQFLEEIVIICTKSKHFRLLNRSYQFFLENVLEFTNHDNSYLSPHSSSFESTSAIQVQFETYFIERHTLSYQRLFFHKVV